MVEFALAGITNHKDILLCQFADQLIDSSYQQYTLWIWDHKSQRPIPLIGTIFSADIR